MINVFFQTVYPDVKEAWVEKIVKEVLSRERSDHEGAISLIFLDDAEMQQLNRKFFSKDKSTDVIAFPLEDDEDDVWGEVYISVERAEEQAGFYSVSIPEEITRLIVHGVLHLHGYDDLEEPDRGMMTDKENQYLELFKAQGIL